MISNGIRTDDTIVPLIVRWSMISVEYKCRIYYAFHLFIWAAQ